MRTLSGVCDRRDGGGLYWDKAGPVTYCGKPEAECGRIPLVDQPAAVVDDKLAGRWAPPPFPP